jgi:hypothetical protein
LKVKPKANNIAGLQLADLVAHPSFRVALARRAGQALTSNFGGKIGQILLESKYHRSRTYWIAGAHPSNTIEGWGIKWLP